MSPVRSLPAWSALEADAQRLAHASILGLFGEDPRRVGELSFDLGPMHLDLSKHLLDAEALGHLVALAEQADVRAYLDAMLAGEVVNASEGRPASHALGRTAPEALRTSALARFVEQTRGDGSIRDVLVLSIGGSHLGPALVAAALRREADGPALHFVTSVDGASLDAAVSGLDPATTLVVAQSKSFTTMETSTNLELARRWLGPGREAQLAAVTARPELAGAAGIAAEQTFVIDDSIGGRFSVSSAMGLPAMLAVGIDRFIELLEGFAIVDRHLAEAPLERNLPVLLGLVRIWYANFFGAEAAAVVPYATDLGLLVPYLQQVEMESLGKRVTRQGDPISVATGPVIFGGVGTDAQHAFFQLLHQGTHLVPVDLIGVLEPTGEEPASHDLLVASLLAQAEVLATGLASDDPARALPGNRPSSLILLDQLDARSLGALLALYEHATVVQGAVLGLNPFDQWGVEAGKVAATAIAAEMDDPSRVGSHDPSTTAALERFRRARRS